MIRVGIIGGIGSGKSFISKLFGYPVFNADNEVKLIYRKNKKCFTKLRKKLPKFIKSFPIKKKELISAIVSNKKNLKLISSVVHPLVRDKMKKFINKNKKRSMIIFDIPLFIENNLNKKKDIIIFVNSKSSKVLERLKKRPNFNEKLIRSLKESQVMLSKKRKLSNYVINNNFSVNVMKKKVKLIKQEILNERNSSRY
jgi:dephospho-CoA kinase